VKCSIGRLVGVARRPSRLAASVAALISAIC